MRASDFRFLFTGVLCLLLMGCGTSTQPQQMPPGSGPISSPASPPTSVASSLPSTATIDFTGLSLLEVVFRTQLNINRIDDLYATTRGKVDNISVISNCDLDVLKGFIVTGWAPVVLLHSGGRNLWAVAEYDDTAQQIRVVNPVTRVGRTFPYPDFEKEWVTASGQKCALITPGKLNEARVHSVLERYLPAQKVAQVGVRSR